MKAGQVRIISLKRLILAILLGFLIPLSYGILLSEASDLAGKTAPQFMVAPFGWPRPLWIFLLGRQPLESDLIGGIVFLALCNIVLYGIMAYALLLAVSLVRRKRTIDDPPPLPDLHDQEEESTRAAGNPGVEQVSIDEAQHRYDSFLNGEIEALPGDAVMARARSRLK